MSSLAGHGKSNATQLLRKSDFLRRNGAFVATRARVELVHARRARAPRTAIWARQLDCTCMLHGNPLPSLATVGDAVVKKSNARLKDLDNGRYRSIFE